MSSYFLLVNMSRATRWTCVCVSVSIDKASHTFHTYLGMSVLPCLRGRHFHDFTRTTLNHYMSPFAQTGALSRVCFRCSGTAARKIFIVIICHHSFTEERWFEKWWTSVTWAIPNWGCLDKQDNLAQLQIPFKQLIHHNDLTISIITILPRFTGVGLA